MHRQTAIYVLNGCLLFVGSAYSMEGTFSRDQEAMQYVEIMENGTAGAAAIAAKQIYISGISDARLAAAIDDRLRRDYPGIDVPEDRKKIPASGGAILNATHPGIEVDYGKCLIKALASQGRDEYAGTLRDISRSKNLGGSQVRNMRTFALRELHRMEWHKRKNAAMASRANYVDGEDPRIAMLINLLRAEEASLRDFGFDRIESERIRNARVDDVLEQQVQLYLNATTLTHSAKKDIARSIYLLGMSGERSHREVLQKVMQSNAEPRLKKQAQVALDRLK